MAELWANNSVATLANNITSTTTSIPLTSGFGSLFPSPSPPDYFWTNLVTTVDGVVTQREICKCTANSADILTVVRGQQGTIAVAFNVSGSTVEHGATALTFGNLAQLLGADFSGPISTPTISLTTQLTPLTTPIVKNSNYNAVNLQWILADTSAGAWTLGLPTTPGVGWMIVVSDLMGTFGTNNLTVANNSSNILGNNANMLMDVNNSTGWFYYTGSSRGWILIQP